MAERNSNRGGLKLQTVLHFLALLLIFVVCVFPFYWMVTASLKATARHSFSDSPVPV